MPGILTMLLVMALVTTAMTGPLLSLALRLSSPQSRTRCAARGGQGMTILSRWAVRADLEDKRLVALALGERGGTHDPG